MWKHLNEEINLSCIAQQNSQYNFNVWMPLADLFHIVLIYTQLKVATECYNMHDDLFQNSLNNLLNWDCIMKDY